MNKLKINHVDKFKSVHKDLYDYSKFKYNGCEKKSIIICKKHGEFLQSYSNHSRGRGCPECKKEKIGNKFRSNKKEFIKKANIIHRNKYIYNKIYYINNHTKIKIICPIHSLFLQTPNDHLNGCGCPLCGIMKKIDKRKSNSIEFINKSKKIHGDEYDYSKIEYRNNAHQKVKIICKKHGYFWQTPASHLRGNGCPVCINRISKPEIEFLDYIGIPKSEQNRQVRIGKFKVDGIISNIIYEFFGDYYHGNPLIYKSKNYNSHCKKTFDELYNNTLIKLEKLHNMGYRIKYLWESDWNKFKKNTTSFLNIQTY